MGEAILLFVVVVIVLFIFFAMAMLVLSAIPMVLDEIAEIKEKWRKLKGKVE